MNKYKVTPINESSVSVDAERMELLDKSVTLYVGDEVKAFFPHIESVVVDFPAKPSPCSPTGSLTAVATEIGTVDLPPTVSIGAINITASNLDGLAGALSAFSDLSTTRANIRI